MQDRKDDLKILVKMKSFTMDLSKYINNFPNKERIIKDKIISTCYDLIEIITLCNMSNEKEKYKYVIVSKLSLLDFCFEWAYKNNYISEKQLVKICNKLTEINKMVCGWIKND